MGLLDWKGILKADSNKNWLTTTEDEYNEYNINDKIRYHRGMIRHYLGLYKRGQRTTAETKAHRTAAEFFQELAKNPKLASNITYDMKGLKVQDTSIPEEMTLAKYVTMTKEDKIEYHRKSVGIKVNRPKIQPNMSKEGKFHREMLQRLAKKGSWLNEVYTYPSLEELEKKKAYTKEKQWEELGLNLKYE